MTAYSKFKPLVLLSGIASIGGLCAQAPADWTRLGGEHVTEVQGKKITHLGPWRSPDGSLTVIVGNMGPIKEPQELIDLWAGMISGIVKKGGSLTKIESGSKPHPALVIRLTAERGEIKAFSALHLILTQKGAITVQVHSAKPDPAIDLAKWDLGEPIQDEGGKMAETVEKLGKTGNASLAELQDLAKKVREAAAKP